MDQFYISSRKRGFALIALVVAVFAILGCGDAGKTNKSQQAKRLVVIGGSATEVVYALGAGGMIVATDTSSVYPVEATKLPQVGYQRTISAEGVVAQKPDLVLALPETGPPAALAQIKQAGIVVETISNEHSVEGVAGKIAEVAKALGMEAKGEELLKNFRTDVDAALRECGLRETRPSMVVLFARGSGSPMISGSKTAADAMIKIVGGENSAKGFEGYKPLTPEALVEAAPDYVIVPSRAFEAMGGKSKILSIPGMSETPAGKNGNVISIDDALLLGFTPRLGIGIKELCAKIR
ncbi:MAG: ABC transporter substrate-binding protein [Pyrinomonadaceae bacterium]